MRLSDHIADMEPCFSFSINRKRCPSCRKSLNGHLNLKCPKPMNALFTHGEAPTTAYDGLYLSPKGGIILGYEITEPGSEFGDINAPLGLALPVKDGLKFTCGKCQADVTTHVVHEDLNKLPDMLPPTVKVRCVVPVLVGGRDGKPGFFPCVLELVEPIRGHDVQEAAQEEAKEAGHEVGDIIYEEKDGPDFLFKHFFPS